MLDLYKLEIFAIVVEAGSFSGAAERLLLTQPAISQHIQDLEAALGARLFTRGRRGVSLTPAGETLHGYTKAIFRLLAEAENAVTDVTQLASGQVTVAATPGLSVYLLPEWALAFRNDHPNLGVTIQTSITPQILHDLLLDKMDFGLIEGELDEPVDERVGVLALEEVEQLVVVGPSHPWWSRSHVDMADLDQQVFVMRQRHSQTRTWIDGALAAEAVRYRVAAEFDNVESIKRAVMTGMGITILPGYAVRSEVEMGQLRAISVSGAPLQRTLKLVWKFDRPFPPVVRAFLRFLERFFPTLRTVAALSGADRRPLGVA